MSSSVVASTRSQSTFPPPRLPISPRECLTVVITLSPAGQPRRSLRSQRQVLYDGEKANGDLTCDREWPFPIVLPLIFLFDHRAIENAGDEFASFSPLTG
jgi:hypothetical protein